MVASNALSRGVFVVAAKRTPFGTFGGSLKSHSPTDLSVSLFTWYRPGIHFNYCSQCASLADCQYVIDLSFLDSMTPGDSLQRSYQGVRPLPWAHQLRLHWQCSVCLRARCSLLGQACGPQVWPACANACAHRLCQFTKNISLIFFTHKQRWCDVIFSTVNRLCGSGFQSIVNGVQEILAGDAKVAELPEKSCWVNLPLCV